MQNIHPAIVHFPIALLTVYVLFEFLSWTRLAKWSSYLSVKTVLLVTGFLGALASLSTGELGEHLYASQRQLVETHDVFATAATGVFGVLTIIYLIQFIETSFSSSLPAPVSEVWKFILQLKTLLFKKPILILLALVGFVLLTITGALGATLVYGPDADIFTQVVNALLFP